MSKPFIKWVGGKTQLLDKILPLLGEGPLDYYEPFIGGGAVFFALASQKRLKHAVINDWNGELVTAYRVVQMYPETLLKRLQVLQDRYAASPYATFTEVKATLPIPMIDVAARFIFLNRTGFNGLYRVNRKGEFNVAWGKYENPAIANEALITDCSEALKGVVITEGDFEACVATASRGAVAYFDPPYIPVTATANFTSYTNGGFPLSDHRRLAQLGKTLAEKGVRVVISNSDTVATRDIYDGYEVHEVLARRNVNTRGDGRGAVSELLLVRSAK
jgi:DNA adenine methylase